MSDRQAELDKRRFVVLLDTQLNALVGSGTVLFELRQQLRSLVVVARGISQVIVLFLIHNVVARGISWVISFMLHTVNIGMTMPKLLTKTVWTH